MTTFPADPHVALEAADSQDLVQKKLAIDAMKKRVNGGPSEEKKLREACEGFESIFLQKMWEQMRKNVKKEGYLHSKDEEAYQSMFDTELAKKMASAGGIGLGDMLYEQLGKKLTHISRATGTGAMRSPLSIEPVHLPKSEEANVVTAPGDLYTETEQTEELSKTSVNSPLEEALAELAQQRDPAFDPANATYPMFDMQNGTPLNPVANRMGEESRRRREGSVNPLPERVSAPGKSRPSNSGRNIGRTARNSRRNAQSDMWGKNPTAVNQATPQGGVQRVPHAAPMTNQQTTPLEPATAAPAEAPAVSPTASPDVGRPVTGAVVSSYGRQTAPDGSTVWNTGVQFDAAANEPVTAPMDGVVAFVGEKGGVDHVILRHAEGLTTHYMNARSTLAEGDVVMAGMKFAFVTSGGGTPAAPAAGGMGFELRRGELALNPEKLLA